MYNPVVNQAFQFSPADSQRYGNTGFGNACLVAGQVLKADQGTRFVQITQGGWDMHQNIYAANQLPTLGKLLDDGLSALLGDLQAGGMLDETLVVMAGEFGPHGRPAHCRERPRPLPPAVRHVRRRGRQGRPGP